MAKKSLDVKNKKRKKIIEARSPELKAEKNKLKSCLTVNKWKNVIANIDRKIHDIHDEAKKDTLMKERAIYANKISTAVSLSPAEVWDTQLNIDRIGKEVKTCQARLRCSIPTCSRPRGVFRFLGLCRLHIRELASKRLLPGRIFQRSW